jgi:hypothetical protein
MTDQNTFHMFILCQSEPRMYASTTFDQGVPPAILTASTQKYNIEILFAASDLVTLSFRVPKRVVEMNTHPIPDKCLHLYT